MELKTWLRHRPLYQENLKELHREVEELIADAIDELETGGSASKFLTLLDVQNILEQVIQQSAEHP